MKLTTRLLISLILPLFLMMFSSCAPMEEIKIGAIKQVEFKGMNDNILSFRITATIENPNHLRLHVNSSDLNVFLGNREIGKVKQMDGLVIESHCTKDYTIQLKVEVNDITSMMGPAMQLMSGSGPEVKLTGDIKVRSFLYQRKISVSDFKLMR